MKKKDTSISTSSQDNRICQTLKTEYLLTEAKTYIIFNACVHVEF